MSKRTILSVLSFSIFILVSLVIILLAQGYRLDRTNRQLYETGTIAINSEPTGASVLLNGQLHGVSNGTLSDLIPGQYTVKLTKDGYTSWQQRVTVAKGKVVTLSAVLVPVNPSLAPVSSTPVENPLLSPDGQKLAYMVSEGTSAGVWVLDLSSQPFNLVKKPVLLLANTPALPYSSGQLAWSPTSKDLLITLSGIEPANYIAHVDSPGSVDPVPDVSVIKSSWSAEQDSLIQELGSDLPKSAQDILQQNKDIAQWSPDNLKFLYYIDQDNKRTYYVYDKESKKTFQAASVSLDKFTAIRWYADSQHLIVLDKDTEDATTGTVSVMGMDGTNKQQAFKGTLMDDALYAYQNGAKLIILTSFNAQQPQYYLYTINLR